ncbi:MAG TPA: helix-turn-helix transcriptional regulator [Verrucomicrobiae bacterium]|nr:helix-turn-helix transcriptional regulator [Verrucomicrobiae bacterium]
MIKTDSAYNAAVKRLKDDREHMDTKRQELLSEGLDEDQVNRVLEPELSFHLQLQEEVEWYESVRRGDLQTATSLQELGRLLIALRIAAGLSQRELAEMLDVHESQVSRDERNEYYGITAERAQCIIEALKGQIEIYIRPNVHDRELQPA